MSSFLHCSEIDVAAGMRGASDEPVGLSQLKASRKGVRDALEEDASVNSFTGILKRQLEDARENPPDRQIWSREGSKMVHKTVKVTPPSRPIDAKLAFERYGIRLPAGEWPEGYVAIKAQRKREENYREAIFARSDSFWNEAGGILNAEAKATLQPVDLAVTLLAPKIGVPWFIARIGRRPLRKLLEGAYDAVVEFSTTELLVELQNRADDIGRDTEEFFSDFFEEIVKSSLGEVIGDAFGRILGRVD